MLSEIDVIIHFITVEGGAMTCDLLTRKILSCIYFPTKV